MAQRFLTDPAGYVRNPRRHTSCGPRFIWDLTQITCLPRIRSPVLYPVVITMFYTSQPSQPVTFSARYSECRFLVERITVETLSPKAVDSATHFATLLRILKLSMSSGGTTAAAVAHSAVGRVDDALFQGLEFQQVGCVPIHSVCCVDVCG